MRAMLVLLPLYAGVATPIDYATPLQAPLAWEASGIIRMVFTGLFDSEV